MPSSITVAWNGDLLQYIDLKKEITSMISGDLDLWDMVTKKVMYNPWCVLNICAKNEVDPTIGLGGVWWNTHTDIGPTAIIYSMNTCSAKSLKLALHASQIYFGGSFSLYGSCWWY